MNRFMSALTSAATSWLRPGCNKHGTNAVAYWGVADAAYAELLKKGARKHGEPQEVGDGIITATVEDPFGNVIGIIENPHFKIQSGK